MNMNISTIKEIIVAVVSNPNFFVETSTADQKIQQVCNLITEVDKTVKK